MIKDRNRTRSDAAAYLIALTLAAPGLGWAASCTTAPQNPAIAPGQSVTWSYSSSGFAGTPTRAWTFQGGNPATSPNTRRAVSYAGAGTFNTSLTLTRGTTVANCSTTVRVGAADAVPPTVSVNTAAGGPFAPPQTVVINATATDNVGVTRVVCHYTPALDLAQLGPLAGAPGTLANGRNQVAHKSNSNVMHSHHGSLAGNLFPAIPAPVQSATTGAITNQTTRLAALENNCYQCHPGKNTKCLRGAMFNGGMLCSDCHGSMAQVGNDFSRKVSPSNPGAFILAKDFYTNANTPRVPWAHEPGCGSCHTGDASSNLASQAGVLVNTRDTSGNQDGTRLRQAFKTGDAKATPIVPTNKRFAEAVVPASFNGFANPGAGNPKLYRVSSGHGGVMCEGCHGATHAEWPNGNPNANDNVTARQLQGHTGIISECGTCHTTSALPANTQGGPHGMHLVNDSRFWSQAHKDAAKKENAKPGRGTCGACHGADHKGTVLSRAPVTRTWRVESSNRTVTAGQAVACDVCHSLSKSFDD